MHAYIHAYIHTYIRTYIHTHTYIHTYIHHPMWCCQCVLSAVQMAMATAQVLFHRFYYAKSFLKYCMQVGVTTRAAWSCV